MNWHQRVAFVMLSGALAFTLPTLLVHVISGDEFGLAQVALLTIVTPCVCWLAGRTLENTPVVSFRRREVSSWMLAGIWVLGPMILALSSGWPGSGIVMMVLLFPVGMWVIATYTGSLGALFIVSVMLGYRVFGDVSR